MTPTLEQMELAARAAGIEWFAFDLETQGLMRTQIPPALWNPLTSGDDSQRLQAKLRMSLDYQKVGGKHRWLAVCRQSAWESTTKAICFNPAIPDDDLRAMKEAIFLVAVEVGRAK